MAQHNVMEIFKLLDKSNCRKCNEMTCLAFAAAIFKGRKQLDECPNIEKEIIEQYGKYTPKQISAEQLGEEAMAEMKKKITLIDLSSAADRLGAKYSNGKLTIKCLGKDFSVDTKGNIITEIHVNPWITVPVLNYIIDGAGIPVSGKWVTFRELDAGENRYPLFAQRCENPLKRVADTYTGLFEDMLQIFNGRQVDYHYPADLSVVLHPLPKVPIMICYSKPEDGLESSLTVFFDSTILENLNFESVFTLGIGLVMMFEKIALNHGLK